MRIIVSLRGLDDKHRDYLVEAEGDALIADVLRRMGAERAAAGAEGVLVHGLPIDITSTLRDSGIRHGTILVVARDRPESAPDPGTTGLVDIGVAGGPGSGSVVRLGPGRHAVGGAESRGVRLPGLPDVALVVEVNVLGGVRVRVATTSVQATLADKGLTLDFVDWPPSADIRIGERLVQHRAVSHTAAVLEPSVDGGTLEVHRPPRFRSTEPDSSFTIPEAPAPAPRNSWPWVAALLPVVGAAASALLFGSPAFLLLAAFTPVVAFANAFTARRRGTKSYAERAAEHEQTVAAIEADLEHFRSRERTALIQLTPSAADLWPIVTLPTSKLWERRFGDDDHLLVRVGTADQPSRAVVEDRREPLEHQRPAPRMLLDVPATMSLASSGVVGIAGPSPAVRSTAGWVVSQLAIMQSPRDLQFYIVAADAPDAAWNWAAWLPHSLPALGQQARALIGNDADTIGRRVAELNQLVSARQTQNAASFGKPIRFTPEVVIVWDGARRLRSYPGVATILRDGPAVGIYSVCLDEDERSLPEECEAVVVIGADRDAVIRRSGQQALPGVRLDVVEDAWLDAVARSLAPLRDSGDREDSIPTNARLTEVLDLEPVRTEDLLRRWSGGARTTRAVVGVALDGPFSIDLVADGPHGLMAGTTGSGKSELLQTLVASLAVGNRPDAINFVLVDYKGGAAFKDAVHLPHTVGMVTDLDAHLVERALTSLGAELTRREHLLAAVGAKDIGDYLDEASKDRDRPPMPRLLIVIDEFASMARELPDFVKGLVNIAQRGRSLGIHLILATQRPSGVVSGEIRANTNLRISLRVTDAADSSDVIDAPDAARIPPSLPGRAYVRLGHSSLVPFQAARVGGRGEAASAAAITTPFVVELDWAGVGDVLPKSPSAEVQESESTDLSRIVAAARDAAERLALPPNHSPWLPALATSVMQADLQSVEYEEPRLRAVPWALADLPAEQAQQSVTIDFDDFSHLFLVGSARSGRSQALRTIAGAIADGISSADVHLFGVDMGNGALLPLGRLPHTGAIVQRSERERVVRLFERLQTELTRRQEMLGRLGVADIGEQRVQAERPAERLPHLVLLVDRWESFVSTFGDADGGALVETVLGFLREGAGAGLHLVLAGDRSLLSGRIGVLTEDKWMLRLADRSDYSMGSVNPRLVPESMSEGRMLRAGSGQEAQVALLAPDVSATGQAAALTEIAARARHRDRDVPRSARPLRIDLLPTSLTWEEAQSYVPAEPRSPLWSMVGIGGDELNAIGPDFATGAPTFLVAGPPRSGRSNALAVLTRSLLESGSEVVLLTPRRSPLTAMFTDMPGVRRVIEGAEVAEADLAEVLVAGDKPVVLVIDDGEAVREMPAKEFLRGWMRGGAGGDRGVVLGGNSAEVAGGFSGWQIDIRNNQRGALLSPRNVLDGDLLGVRIPRSLAAAPVTPGRALVHLGGGTLQTVQVPQLLI